MSQTPLPTDAELAILAVLWRFGPSTVRAVHDELSATHRTGYTTTLKTMQVMDRKGLLARDASQRSHVYRARRREQQVQAGFLKELTQKAFGGSASRLVVRALASQPASSDELKRIRQLLDEIESGRRSE